MLLQPFSQQGLLAATLGLTSVTFRFMLSMPAYMENSGLLSTKLVLLYKREEGSTLPSTQATVLLLDPEFGNIKAVSN